jgi:Ca2+-binding EF-hand superfamily protein
MYLTCSRIMIAAVHCAVLASPEVAQRQTPSLAQADHATMIIMAPLGPVVADLRISVAKIPYRTWVSRFVASQMDVDKNTQLDSKELSLLTENVRRLGNIPGPEEILAGAVKEPGATEVPTKQFVEWLQTRLPKSFDLIAQPQAADDAVRLTSLLDANLDASISDAELLNSLRALRFRDLDNDETFSVSELMPYRDPRSQNAPVSPDVVNLPFYHVTDEASGKLAAERIVGRYGSEGTVAIPILRQQKLPESDRRLNVDELADILQQPEFHLTIDVKLSDRAGTSDIDVAISSSAESFCRTTDDKFGQTAIVADGLPLRIVARGGGANNRAVTRGFLGQTFVMIDGDRNQYLDETEFSGIVGAMQQSGANGDFATVDQNSDKMVTRDELFSFVERDLMAAASRIEVTVKQDGKTLFSLLDANQDRRLSAREIRNGTAVLQKYDRNADGSFAETELGTEYVLTLGLGRSELRRNSGMMTMQTMAMNSGDAVLPGLEGLNGPEWFRRMDRNQDGDVSVREFLGTSTQFAALDTDQDGLMSASEAEVAEKAEAAEKTEPQ